MRVTRTILVLGLLCLVALPCRADVLHLMNGGRLEGKVIQVEGGFKVITDAATTFVPVHRVRWWQKKPTPDEVYEQKKNAAATDDLTAQMALADWCRDNRMYDRARWHYTLCVAIEPDNEKARARAGFVRHGAEWITKEEMMRRKGMEFYRGKWRPLAEVIRRRRNEAEEEKHKAVYKQAWKLIREVARRDDLPLPPAAEALVGLGRHVLDPVERAAADISPRARELALMTLEQFTCQESLDILLRRLRRERREENVYRLIDLFPRRQDRMQVLNGLLHTAMNNESAKIRKRACMALLALADTRAVEALIPQAAFCPNPPLLDENGKPEEDTEAAQQTTEVDGAAATVGRTKQRPPYYPACEALNYLCDEALTPNVERWKGWWGRHKADFRFRPVPGLARWRKRHAEDRERTQAPPSPSPVPAD